MDNNNPPQQPSAPQPQPNPAVVQSDAAGNNKAIFWLIGGLILIILVVGGIYWYLSSKQTVQPAQPTVSKSATGDTFDQDLNSIDVQAADSDFTSVDQDLQSL